jgi:drug/metabolite transporter (DMT)-like permease
MSREKALADAAMAGMALLFGASFVATKMALGSFTPSLLICMRFLAASAVFYAVSPLVMPERLSRAVCGQVFLLALFEPGAYFYLEAMGIQRTLASTAAILISTIPLFVLVLEALWLDAPLVPLEVALILLSLGGVFLLVTAGGWERAVGGSLAGNLFVLGAALAASLYTVLAKRILTHHSPLAVTRLQVLYAAGLYLPAAGWDLSRGAALPADASSWWALAYLAFGCSFLAYWLLNYSLSKVKASVVSAFTNLIPVVGSLLALLVLGERLYPMQGVGAAIVLGCTTLLALRRKEG